MMSNSVIILSIACLISVSVNTVLVMYSRNFLSRLISASESVSDLFIRLDAYREHLTSVYELPTFYGDETLKGLLDHTNDLATELTKYEELYSLTQPDLIEQLEIASEEIESDSQTTQTQAG